MATYLMFGKYSAESMKDITPERTKKVIALLENLGAKIEAMYALLGEHDLVLVLDLEDNERAMRASVALSTLTGIGFKTCPAVTVGRFDELIGE